MLASSGWTELLCHGAVSLLPAGSNQAAGDVLKGSLRAKAPTERCRRRWEQENQLGRVVEWQTRWTQNPLAARP